MFFNTIQYLVFLPIVLLLYYLTKPKYRWLVLFLASCYFYMYFIPEYILCLFFLILVDFFMAKKIHQTENERRRKVLLFLSILSNFGLLFYFKYLGFFVDNLNIIWPHIFGSELKISGSILPIGLSFHTFQSVSYVIDVYKKKIESEKHLGIYSTYVLFFPQMVAGPIERFSGLGNELKKTSSFQYDFFKKAIPLILMGLFYKMVIADNCGEYVNETYSHITTENNINVLFAVFLFCIQIYSDFFGYSLIAQGSARLFGIKLIDNFSFPFFSENIIEFWKKWHISLTGWFRDYVYIPLGGSKRSVMRHYFNIMVIFGLSGLWHGAGFNFIAWGILHGLAYLITASILKRHSIKIPKGISYAFTFIIVSLIFVFFRSGKISESLIIFKSILHNTAFSFHPLSFIVVLNILFIFSLEYFARKHINYTIYLGSSNLIIKTTIFTYLLFAICLFSGIDNLPFIYFQF